MTTATAFKSNTQFSHVKPGDTQFLPGGLRDFFLYRDLGVAKALGEKVVLKILSNQITHKTEVGLQLCLFL